MTSFVLNIIKLRIQVQSFFLYKKLSYALNFTTEVEELNQVLQPGCLLNDIWSNMSNKKIPHI